MATIESGMGGRIFAAFEAQDPALLFWATVAILLISLVIAIPAGVEIVRWFRRQDRVLTHQIVSDVGVINHLKDLGEEVEISVKRRPVEDARLVIVRLANAGPETVRDTERIRVRFNPPRLIRGAIHGTDPPGMIGEDDVKKRIELLNCRRERGLELHEFARLKQLTLNTGESIDLKFLTRGHTALEVLGQIDGGRIAPYVPQDPRRIRRVVALLVVALLVAVLAYPMVFLITAGLQGNCQLTPSPLRVDGSSAFYPTAQAAAEAYRGTCPLPLLFNDVSVASSASGNGLNMLANGSIQVADSELAAPRSSGFVEHRVAAIVFAIIVNRSVTNVHSLTRAQITDIYSGATTNWRDVGGPDLPITLIGRSSDSGTHASFSRFVLQGQEKPIPRAESNTSEVIKLTSTTPGAIGYADLGASELAEPGVTTVEIDGRPATAGLVASGAYPFWAIERMYTASSPDSVSTSFVSYVTDYMNRTVRNDDTFVRVNDFQSGVLTAHE